MRRVKVKADHPDPSHVQMAVDAIRAGASVALPTETVYGLAADPSAHDSVARVRALKDRPGERAFTWHVASADVARSMVAGITPPVQRLMERYWPGPLTLVLAGRDGEHIGLRVPDPPFTRAVLAAFERGLFLTSANRSGEPPLVTPDEIADGLPELDLLCDAGPPPLAQASAVARKTGPRLEVLREGTLRADEILRTAAASILFVCTGNTCRSPLAAALARRRIAERLGLDDHEVLACGLDIASAGVTAGSGTPASGNAILAGLEVGIDLRTHRSRRVSPELVAHAGRVYALTRGHLLALLDLAPDLEGRATLLDSAGHDIPDPFGGSVDTYRLTREAMSTAIDARLGEMLALIGT